MTITAYNQAPYFDDYTTVDVNGATPSDKHYHRILFQPNYAVQARELNQLQSILQDQIDKFGQSVYKPGTPVIDGLSNFNDNVPTIDVSITNQDVVDNINTLRFIEVRGQTAVGAGAPTTIAVEILGYRLIEDNYRLWVRYLNTVDEGSTLPISADVYLTNDVLFNDLGLEVNISTSIGTTIAVGAGFSITVDEGIFFINGSFVHSPKQTTYFSKTPSAQLISGHVAFHIQENIINTGNDSTLLDNAAGSPNYAAPGADRYQILLRLGFITSDSNLLSANATVDNIYDESAIVSQEFNRLLKVTRSNVHRAARTEYSQLNRVLAQRTFEESGNYTVQPFLSRVRDFLKTEDQPDGRYTQAEFDASDLFGLNTAGEDPNDYLILEIEPAVAYVEGYRIELNQKKSVLLPKARTTATFESVYLTYPRGNFVDVKFEIGHDDTNALSLINGELGKSIRGIKYLRTEGDFIYYRLFVYNDFDNTVDLETIMGLRFSYDGTSQVINSTSSNTSIFPLPYEAVNGFGTGGIEYVKQQLYSETAVGTQVVISAPAGELFVNINKFDLIVFNANLNTYIGPTYIDSIVAGGNTLTINFDAGAIYNGDVIEVLVPVLVDDSTGSIKRRAKTITAHDEPDVVPVNGKITLSKQDVILDSIVVSGVDAEVVPHSVLFDGQTSNFYESPVIRVPVNANTEEVTINYEYFEHSTGDYFSAESYPANYVPPFFNGRRISDCIDFRVKKLSDGTIPQLSARIQPNSTGELTIEAYLPRYDKLVIDSSSADFKLIQGTPSLSPKAPSTPSASMPLYTVKLPGYTYKPTDVKLDYIDNKRYTMRGIGKLEKRIANLEYYTSLSLLEKEAVDKKVLDLRPGSAGAERFKNGILVDSFIGHNVGAVQNPDYVCSIDPENGILRPYFKQENFRLKYVPPTNAIYGKAGGEQVNVWAGAKEEFLSNRLASATMSVQPYMVTVWEGSLKLSPSSDEWMDTLTKPTVTLRNDAMGDAIEFLATSSGVLGTKWNSWTTNWVSTSRSTAALDAPHTARAPDGILRQRVATSTATTSNQSRSGINTRLSFEDQEMDLGERVVDMSIVPFIRSRDVAFRATGLKPFTKLYAFFDDIDVTDYCINTGVDFILYGENNDPATYNGETPDDWAGDWGTLITDENGDINGVFRIPNNSDLQFRTGQRTLVLTSSPVNSSTEKDAFAENYYNAAGLLQTKETRVISTRTPVFSQQRVQENRTVSSSTSNVSWVDPIAQTFVVTDEYPNGLFLSDIDLFFATKPDANLPVEIYLVSVENGIPTQDVIPGSKVQKHHSDINVSGRDPDMSSPLPATNFAFDYPLYLQAGTEYALIVFSPSPDYRVWTSELGKRDIQTGSPITKNPEFGVLLKSQNRSTWTPDQLKDLMLVMNKAVFPTNSYDSFKFITRFDSNNQNMPAFNFSVFNLFMESLTLPGTTIAYELKFKDAAGGDILAPGTYTGVEAKENYSLRSQLVSPADCIEVTATLNTTDTNLTPVIDLERVSVIGIENVINDSSIDEGDAPDGGEALARYITKTVQLSNPADEIRVVLAVNRPSSEANIKVYAKRKTPTENNINAINWIEMPLLSVNGDASTDVIPVYESSTDFAEVEYVLPAVDPNVYDPAEAIEFDEFEVKIVLLSSNIARVPTLRDLRAIATL